MRASRSAPLLAAVVMAATALTACGGDDAAPERVTAAAGAPTTVAGAAAATEAHEIQRTGANEIVVTPVDARLAATDVRRGLRYELELPSEAGREASLRVRLLPGAPRATARRIARAAGVDGWCRVAARYTSKTDAGETGPEVLRRARGAGAVFTAFVGAPKGRSLRRTVEACGLALSQEDAPSTRTTMRYAEPVTRMYSSAVFP